MENYRLVSTIDTTKALVLKLLKNALTEKDLRAFSQAQWQEVHALCGRQNVKAYCYFLLSDHGLEHCVPSPYFESFKEAFTKQTLKNLAYVGELHRVGKALGDIGIPVIALKGLHMLESVYPHIGTRHMRDLDLLIPAAKAEKAFYCTDALGYKAQIPYEDDGFHQLPMQVLSQKQIALELHRSISDEINFDNDLLWKDARPAPTHHNFHLLSLENLFLHLCIHISYADYFKIDLRHYLDIYLLLTKYKDEMDWEETAKRSHRLGCFDGVRMTLLMIARLFNSPFQDIAAHFQSEETENATAEALEIAMEFLWAYDKASPDYRFSYKWRPRPGDSKKGILGQLKRIFIRKDLLRGKFAVDKNSQFFFGYYFLNIFHLAKLFMSMKRGKGSDYKSTIVIKTMKIHAFLDKSIKT